MPKFFGHFIKYNIIDSGLILLQESQPLAVGDQLA
jgi:hypothetical protein